MARVSDAPAAADADTDADRVSRGRFRGLPRWARWSTYVVGVLVLTLIGGSIFAVNWVRRPYPQVEGTIEVPGLAGSVEVLRDDAGIPHVYADTSTDLFFAQGYVQAQDRFYEMDVKRHITAGRLSEMFGPDTLETDKVVRTMGWRRIAEQELGLLDGETVELLTAYTAGVNAYLDTHSASQISLEYTLLGLSGVDHRIEPWTPVDSLSWLKAMAWDLRGNMQEEIERVSMSTRLDPKQIEDLFPEYPFDRHRPIVEGGAVSGGQFRQDAGRTPRAARPAYGPEVVELLEQVGTAMDRLPTMFGRGSGIGSNSWVVDGDHSSTGAPLLANDPHLAPSVPSIWYQMGLHCRELTEDCDFDVTGFTFAGFPGVVIGHNADIAWGFTNLGPDVADLYLEAVDGDDYRRGRKMVPLETRRETIKIAGEDPFVFTARSSVHGPLLSDVAQTYATLGANAPVQAEDAGDVPLRGSGYAVALAWTALQPNRTADAVFALNRAGDWDEFRAAARDFAVPSQNLIYADRDGHIGYQAPGRIPIRQPGHDGDFPVAGWDRRNDWTGDFVPFAELPSVLDPEEGYVVTANQAVIDEDYPHYLADSWAYGYRSQRIVEAIEKRGTMRPQDMTALQLDSYNGFAPVLVPYLLDVTPGLGYYAEGQALLADWDFVQDAESAAAAYYNAVWKNLLELTFADELPDAVRPDGGDRWFEVMRRLLAEPNNPWWDDVDTEGLREGRDDILVLALQEARDELTQRQARRVDAWSWGRLHTLTLENQTVGQSEIGLVNKLLNRGPWELGGGSSLVNATGWDAAEGYEVDWVPSMRMVVSLADLDDSRWINLAGASGHAFHQHYTDQTELWVRGQTRPWAFSPQAVAEATVARLTLEPRPQR